MCCRNKKIKFVHFIFIIIKLIRINYFFKLNVFNKLK